MKKAIFLDRDGTIIEDLGYLRSPSEVVFYPGVFEVLRKLQEHFLLFIITNQSGVAKGLINENDVERVNSHITATLAEAGVTITETYVCPHDRSDNCDCIKPKPYLPQQASANYKVDLHRSFVIGDHPCDVQLADNMGGKGIYVLSGHGRKHLDELAGETEIAADISEAAQKILKNQV